MPLTTAQLAIRKTRISATDAAVIYGLNPWKNVGDLWLEKTQDMDPLEENEAMAVGNMVESPLIDWCATSLGVLPDRELGTVVHPEHDWLCATPDAGIAGQNRGIECKSAGIVRGFVEGDKWGDADTDEVPEMHWVQCQVQMAVMEWDAVYLAALVAGRGRVRYFIQRNNKAIDDIIDVCGEWHRRHILGGERPEATPNYETVKRVIREPGKWGTADPALAIAFEEAKENRKLWEDREEAAKSALISAAPGCDGIIAGDQTYTYLTQSLRGIDFDRLRAEFPDAAEACAKISTFPVLRLKAGKKGKAA